MPQADERVVRAALDVHGRPRFAKLSFHDCQEVDCTRTFGLSMRDAPAVPDGFCWSVPRSLTRTLGASSGAGFTNHGLTCLAIMS